MKKYLAKFKVYNGESTYMIPVTTEAKNEKEALKDFKTYECESNTEIWVFQTMIEVKTFKHLWECL